MVQANGAEYQKARFIFSNFFPKKKKFRLWDKMEKYCGSG